MKTLKTLTIVAVTGLVGLTAVHASPYESERTCKGEKHHDGHKRAHMRAMFKQLDLTSSQKEQMKALSKEMHTQMKEKRAKGRGMGHMVTFVSANGFDKQGFIEMATKKSQERIKMRADMFEKRIKILTPQQRTKLITLMQEKKN